MWFLLNSLFNVHIQAHTESNYTNIRLTFSSSTKLNRYIQIYMWKKLFSFKWMDQHSFRLIAQMQTQKWDKPFSYQLGRSAFSQISYLKKFTWAYTQERKHFCVKCVLAFSDSSKLKSHKQIHTREKPCCEVCQSTFSQKSNLKVNLQRHKGEKPYSCSVCVCESAFSVRSGLNRHMRIHTGKKPFSCREYGATFSNNSNLKNIRINTGEQPFSC